ncbi:MAG: pyruvate carboxylase subunit B [Verrucomicrobiia bacterium]
MKPVLFNNTVLRDGHQSLAATRMTTEQMLPAAPILDSVGFQSLETWGGATIDSCLRYLAENPFERLRKLKAAAPKTPHTMLLRGQNIVQYACFPDDVVEAFVVCAARNGVDIFRIFDALNDLRNLRIPIRAVLAAGKHAQGAISYTTSPVHTVEAFLQLGVELEALGCQSLCIKDMAGLITAPAAAALVRELKRRVKVPVILHTHSTAGLAPAAYYAAIEAGVDAVDVSISPFANGTGQPDTLLMLALLSGTQRCPNYHDGKLYDLRAHFQKVYAELAAFTSPANERTDVDILRYQVPGGMLSNFLSQLKEQGMADKWDAVMKEVPYVRECLGWIPLVTPTSQIVGTQAMLNVKFGRWQMVSQQVMDIALGKYGKTPGPIDPQVMEIIHKKSGQEPIEGRPADALKPRMDMIKQELRAKGIPADDEAAVLYAMFPQQTEALLTGKAVREQPSAKKPDAGTSSGQPRKLAITLHGRRHEILIEEV